MLHYYTKFKQATIGISVLVFLPIASVFASPPDSSGTGLLKGISLKKVSSTFHLMKSESGAKVSDKEMSDPSGLFSKFLSGLNAGGFYRAYGWGRSMNTAYGAVAGIGGLGANKIYTIGDGYYEPLMMLYVGGAPTANASIGTEMIVASPFDAYRGPGAPLRTFNNFFTTVLRGNTNTKYGNFGVIAGGIQWTQLSPFTFGSNVGYERYSLWERRPWDPGGNVNTRYASYYYSGTINQDTRFGTRAFKGFMINGYNMPFKTSLDFFYGKTDFNQGIDRESIVKPKRNVGGKITKSFKNNNKIALNTFNSFVRSDSINSTIDVQWNIFTTEFDLNFKGFSLNGEVGMGKYESPTYKRDWGHGIIVNLITPKKYTLLPFKLRYFNIDKSFTSNVSQFSNTSIQEVTNGYIASGVVVLTPFGGNMSNVGDLANNRSGGAINTDIKVWKFKFSIGTQMESEMDYTKNFNQITYGHRINGLTWSRLPGYFPVNGAFGPYGRVKSFYRGVYETVNVTESDTNGYALYKKSYNAFDFQIKFKTKLFNKDIYFYNLNSVNSVQNKASLLPVMNDKAYINARFHEGEVYYHFMRDIVFSVYGGLEYIKGNKYTDTTTAATGIGAENGVGGITGKARDQYGKSLGMGLDIALSNQTSLFLRQRWFSYDDRNFLNEKFQGQETTIELKIFF